VLFSLVNPNHGASPEDAVLAAPPLPVKRCLASSLHTVAHILGPVLTISDILPIYRQHFLLDTDDSVRLNVIRNFPWMFALLPTTPLRSRVFGIMEGHCQGRRLVGRTQEVCDESHAAQLAPA
jgi:hypothetical protein